MLTRNELKLLTSLIREEIGHNFSTKNNEPIQYYETAPVDLEIYPVDDGYNVEINVPDDPSLSTYTRKFATEPECHHFARQYVELVRRTLDQKQR